MGSPMTPDDLRAWRTRMGYTQKAAAEEMCMPYRSYRALEEGYRAIKPWQAKLVELLEA